MFLIIWEYGPQSASIIDSILVFIRENSVLVGGVVAVVTSSFWMRKLLKQKRAEAFFGFYTRLLIRMKSLRALLEENGQLEVSNYIAGNIFALVYKKDVIEAQCPRYKVCTAKELESFKDAASELKRILLETDCNVYPQKSKRDKWYESQYILFTFCEYLESEKNHHTTNKAIIGEGEKPLHIKKCEEVVEAMNYIQKSIESAKY